MQTSLDAMSALARALVDANTAVADAEAALKKATEKARLLREETIPSAMQELGLEKLVLNTGEEISIKPDVYASIPTDFKDKAHTWLSDHGFGDLIKVEVFADYRMGERDKALELLEELRNRGLEAGYQQGVHPQTLKAFLREQLAKGSDVPLDLFGASPIWTTKITTPKKKGKTP